MIIFKKYILWPLLAWIYVCLSLNLIPVIKHKLVENFLFYSIPFILYIFVYIGYIKTLKKDETTSIYFFHMKHLFYLLLVSIFNIFVYSLGGYLVLMLLNFYKLIDISTPIELYTIIFCLIYMVSITKAIDKKVNSQKRDVILFSYNFVILITLIFIGIIHTRFW